METKLTLKLDQDVIQSAKAFAEKNKKSLSRMVEDYFRKLTSENEPSRKFSPLVEELSGIITEKDLEHLDYVAYLEKKYE